MLRAATKAARRSSRSSGSVIARWTYGLRVSVASAGLVLVFAMLGTTFLRLARKYVGYDRPRAGTAVLRPPPKALAHAHRRCGERDTLRLGRRCTSSTRCARKENGDEASLARARAEAALARRPDGVA